MKILVYSGCESGNGAAIAARRLAMGIHRHGFNCAYAFAKATGEVYEGRETDSLTLQTRDIRVEPHRRSLKQMGGKL